MKFVNNWQDFFAGVILTFLIMSLLGIYITEKNSRSDDWWCTYLNSQEKKACETMYDKAKSYIDNNTEEPECTPNYMGGCDY